MKNPPQKSQLSKQSVEITSFAVTDLLLLLTVTCWGSAYLFTKIGLIDIHPLVFASYRTLISAIVFLITLRLMEGKIAFEKKHIYLLLLTGMTGHFLNRICWTYGVFFTTVSKASILWSTSPIFVGIISLIMKWEKARAGLILGILASFAGVYLLVTKGHGIDFRLEHVKGDGFVLVASMCWSVFTVLSRTLLQEYGTLKTAALASFFGFFYMLPVAAWQSRDMVFADIALQSWACLLFVSLVSNYLTHIFWIRGVKYIGPVKTACFQFLVPVVATLTGIIFLNEQLNFVQCIGGVLILAGVYLSRFV
jgi:drug/metabolite transporter (DMT)-like permease